MPDLQQDRAFGREIGKSYSHRTKLRITSLVERILQKRPLTDVAGSQHCFLSKTSHTAQLLDI